MDLNKFFVFGMARSGRAVAALLAGHGRAVTVYDENPDASHDGLPEGLERAGDADWRSRLEACECLVVSPGVPLDHAVAEHARAGGLPVVGEIEVAYHFNGARIIAVTGTNGKSTVVGVIGAILAEAGVDADVAGNIGRPFSESVRESGREVVVLELSSFQLDTIDRFRADVAVLLNVTPDHLDRYHHSFDEYAASKARILNRADENTTYVYNAEDVVASMLAPSHAGTSIPFSSARELDAGVFARGETIVRRAGGREEDVLRRREFTPVGIHNLENAMAAVAACADVPLEPVRRALRSYHPLPHRMELVRVVGGVAYVNDSKATNVDATIMSLRSVDGPVIVILGGRDKEGDFTALVPYLGSVRLAVLIGEAAGAVRAAVAQHCDTVDATDMTSAVRIASDAAVTGDTVLLAPACASFDMFGSYQERGVAFREAVNAL